MRTFTDCPFGAVNRWTTRLSGREANVSTNPFTALVRPMDLHLGALEIHRAEIVFDRRGFSEIQDAWKIPRRRRRPFHPLGWGFRAISGRRIARPRGIFRPASFAAPAGEFPRCWAPRRASDAAHNSISWRKGICSVKGSPVQLDVHGSIAREESAAAGRQTAKAPPRHNLPPDPFRQRHRRNLHGVRPEMSPQPPAAWAGTCPPARGEDSRRNGCLPAFFVMAFGESLSAAVERWQQLQ